MQQALLFLFFFVFYIKYPKSLLENMDILHVNKSLHNRSLRIAQHVMYCIILSVVVLVYLFIMHKLRLSCVRAI